jgi:hypothetical protein
VVVTVWCVAALAETCIVVDLTVWHRVDSGYRVLDREAVEICLDQVRQRRDGDPRPLRRGLAGVLPFGAVASGGELAGQLEPLCQVGE